MTRFFEASKKKKGDSATAARPTQSCIHSLEGNRDLVEVCQYLSRMS